MGDSTFAEDSSPYADIQPSSVNLLCVHPPYLNALNYTSGHSRDLSQVKEPKKFLERITAFAEGSTAYLASNNTCAVLIGDVRRRGRIVPLGAWTLEAFLRVGFKLKDIVVKTQNHDRSSEFYFSSTNGFLLAHEYLYIFRWPSQETPEEC